MTLKKVGSILKASANRPTYRLLYVEDEDQNWEVAELLLREKYQLARAKNAREVFSVLEHGNFDCILMDIQLAGSELNGIEITQILRGLFTGRAPDFARATSDVPIIFVTAYNARYSREELLRAGGDELVPKPVELTRLSLAISRLLARRAMR